MAAQVHNHVCLQKYLLKSLASTRNILKSIGEHMVSGHCATLYAEDSVLSLAHENIDLLQKSLEQNL